MSERDDDYTVLLFLLICIFVGVATQQLLSNYLKNIVPYAVVVFCEGIIISELAKGNQLNIFTASLNIWYSTNAILAICIFLPPLVFGETMALPWESIKGSLSQSLPLATTGVLINAFLTGAFLSCFPFSWSFNLKMLLGSILSTTDPIAVVQLLKINGVSPKLTMLIIGESVLNDATVIILFSLFRDLLEGQSFSTVQSIVFIITELCVAPILGILCGGIALLWLRYTNNYTKGVDVQLQILITFACAYLSFFVAEACHLSGVLTCFCAGCMLSLGGDRVILSHESMHNVWGVVEWLASTVVFMFTGMIYSQRALTRHTAENFGYLIALFLAINAIRLFFIFVHYPFLKKFSISELLFTSWAGLRGTLCIMLGLLVSESSEKLGISEEDADLFFFLAGGIALSTLLINATFSKLLLRKLNLVGSKSVIEVMMLTRLVYDLNKLNESFTEELLVDNKIDSEERNAVLEHCKMNAKDILKSFKPQTENSNLSAYIRRTFLAVVRAHYLKLIQDGQLIRSSYTVKRLMYSISMAISATASEPLSDLKYLQSFIARGERDRKVYDFIFWLQAIKRVVPQFIENKIDRLILGAKNNDLKRSIYMLDAFIKAHGHAQQKMSHYCTHNAINSEKLTELESISDQTLIVCSESIKQVEVAKSMLDSVNDKFRLNVLSQQTSDMVLKKQVDYVNEALYAGLISDKEAKLLLEAINDKKNYSRVFTKSKRVNSEVVVNVLQQVSMMMNAATTQNQTISLEDVNSNI